jgi:DNA-directed RNA polymerase subunit RPC12/RpoP
MEFLGSFKKRTSDGVIKKLSEASSSASVKPKETSSNAIEYVCGRCSATVKLAVTAPGERRNQIVCSMCNYRILFLKRKPVPRVYLAR